MIIRVRAACVICMIMLFSNAGVYARDQLPQEPIVVNGDKVEYFPDTKQAVGTGNISITYKDVVLTCKKIVVYMDTHEAIAEGDVKISQSDAYYTGDRMNYNFDTRKGTVLNGYISAKPIYGRAVELSKPAYKDQFKADKGYVTTCDLENPHYRIQAREAEIYLNDKVVARNVVAYAGSVPIFYLPYYIQPFIDTKSYLNVMVGESDNWGYYVLGSYRHYVNSDHKADVLLDYRSKRGVAGGVNCYYSEKEIGAGAFKVYYAGENNDTTYERINTMKPLKRYRYQWRHKWDMGEELGTVFTAEFNKVKDKNFIQEYFYKEYEEAGRNEDNYASLITSKSGYSTQLLARKRFDKFYTVVERLPDYKMEIYNWQITRDLPVYYSASLDGAYLNKTFDNVESNVQQKDLSTGRIDSYNRLSYNAKILRSLSVTPYAGVENTYYSRNAWGGTNQIRTIFDFGADASIKFYKVYDFNTNFLDLNINRLRHIITPTAGYHMLHQPTIDPANLNQFDEIDSKTAANAVVFGLENRLQTKRPEGASGQMKSVDLATFTINTTYDFRLKKGEAVIKNHDNKFKNFNMQLELKPLPNFTALSKMTIKTKTCAVETESIDLSTSFGKGRDIGIGHRYEKTDLDCSNVLTAQLRYKISRDWDVHIYNRYNLIKSYQEQEYVIIRDLHCWQFEFTCNIKKDPSDITFWGVMTLKAFPNRPIGYRKSYSRAEFGPRGGI